MHTLHPNLHWDQASSILDPYVILGQPPRGHEAGDLPLFLGPNARIRSFTVLYAGSRFGARLQTGHHVMVREDNEVGDDVSIGIPTLSPPSLSKSQNIVGTIDGHKARSSRNPLTRVAISRARGSSRPTIPPSTTALRECGRPRRTSRK